MGYKVWVKTRKNKFDNTKQWWSDKKKLEVFKSLQILGSVQLTAATCGVPETTLRHWMTQPFWKEWKEELRHEENIELSQKLSKTLQKALDQTMDRIENGEAVLDPRTGKVVRVPAKLRDLNKVANDMVEKKELLRKSETGDTDKTPANQITANHLVELANAFAKFATGKEPKEKSITIDGSFTEEMEHYGLQDKNKETT